MYLWYGLADSNGKELISLDLVYQKTDQLREMSGLSEDTPPAIYNLKLKGLNADENGMYSAKDVMDRFTEAIGDYNDLLEEYEEDEAA